MSPTQRQLVARIAEFETLPDNWDSYGGRRSEAVARVAATEFVLSLPDDVPAPFVGPMNDGGVIVEWDGIGETWLIIDFEGGGGYSASSDAVDEFKLEDAVTWLREHGK